MMFTAGLAVGTSALKLVNIHVDGIAAERFVELALVFLLLSDSMGIDLAGLRRHLAWPSRLLLIGGGEARSDRRSGAPRERPGLARPGVERPRDWSHRAIEVSRPRAALLPVRRSPRPVGSRPPIAAVHR